MTAAPTANISASQSTRDPNDVLLDVRGLDAFYGQAQVLFGVDVALEAGEVAALIGRNGAGKTTILKAVMGLVSARAERRQFAGADIDRLPTHMIARLGLGYVPEDRRIFTDLTVDENLEVGRQSQRGRPTTQSDRAAWTPERLFAIFPNLAEMRGRMASRMSGGEQQMLTIARTLMGNPDAVLLDEPSEGLSPLIVEQMAAAVIAMKREGIAVLLSEQNLHFASAVADRVIVVETGHVRYEGPMATIIADAELRAKYLAV